MGEETIGQDMIFALSVLSGAVVLYILAFMMMARAVGYTARQTTEIRAQSKELEQACTALVERYGERDKEIKKVEAEQKALATEITQLQKLCAAAAADSFQVIHEVGMPDTGLRRFDIEIVLSNVALAEGGTRVNPRVWNVRNVAHVWGPDSREAVKAAGRAFPDRYGFVVTRVLSSGRADAGAKAGDA